MKFLTLDSFLKLFKPYKTNATFEEFLTMAQVKSGDKMHPLKKWVADKSIPKKDVKLLFEHIQNKDEYLTRFFTMSLKVHPIHFGDIPLMPIQEMDNNKKVIYKNLIRNLHYKNILQNTKSGFTNVRTYLDVLFDLYGKWVIDYKIMTPSSLFYMKQGTTIFSSYYFRASIMNPYLVYCLNQSVLKGTRIFTPTLGWTSYAYGFLECPETVEYVGIDVIPDVCMKTEAFIRAHSPNMEHAIFCQPSETFHNVKYKEHFDVAFFSPPYYRLELYEGKAQSTTQYASYEEWLVKYWEKTIQVCHYVLQKGGRLCYILSGYGSTTDKNTEQYDLLGDMNRITSKYFRGLGIIPMHNKNVNNTKHRETGEQIMIFIKK